MKIAENSKISPNLIKKYGIWKKILLVFSALLMVIVAVVVFAYSRYLHPTGEIMPGIYSIRNYRNTIPMVNFYIMQAGDKYIAFDGGSDMEQTQKALHRLGISSDDIIAVFITHSDLDHVRALPLFHNATIYSFDAEFRYANTSAFEAFIFEHPNFPHNTIADGEVVEVHNRSVLSVHSPGHTSDSVSFLVDGRYLFVGDLLINPRLARYNEELQRYYIAKVLGIEGVQYVFTGHFGLFRNIRFFRWWQL